MMTREDEQAIRARAEAGTTQHCDTEIIQADVRTLLEALDAIRAELNWPEAIVEEIVKRIEWLQQITDKGTLERYLKLRAEGGAWSAYVASDAGQIEYQSDEIRTLTQQRDELAAALESAKSDIAACFLACDQCGCQIELKELDFMDAIRRADPAAMLRERDQRVWAELKQQLAAAQAREKVYRDALTRIAKFCPDDEPTTYAIEIALAAIAEPSDQSALASPVACDPDIHSGAPCLASASSDALEAYLAERTKELRRGILAEVADYLISRAKDPRWSPSSDGELEHFVGHTADDIRNDWMAEALQLAAQLEGAPDDPGKAGGPQ